MKKAMVTTIQMTREELADLVKVASAAAVRQEFERVGLIVEDAEHRQDAQKDFLFLRSFRERIESASGVIGKAVLTAVLLAALGMLAAGFKLGLNSK